jgi:Domain of unknown function DUF29
MSRQLQRLLAHLLKWRYQPTHRTPSWRRMIRQARDAIADVLEDNQRLRDHPAQPLSLAYRRARRDAADDTGLPLAGTESPRAHLEVAASRRHPSSRVCDPHRANRSDPEFLPLPRRRERSGAPAMWLQNPGIFSCITVGTYLNLLRSLRKNFLAAHLSRRRWTKMSRMLPS